MQRAIRKLLGYSEPNATSSGAEKSGRVTSLGRRPEERSVRNGRPAATRARSSHPQPQVVEHVSALAGASPCPIDTHADSRNHPAARPGASLPAAPAGLVSKSAAASCRAAPTAPTAPTAPGAAAEPFTAASTPPAMRPNDLRASSLPQPLAQAGQQPPSAGSGPGAPVSPNPTAPPPVLRRVSSTPCPPGLSHNSMASTDSSAPTDEAAAARSDEGRGSGSGSSKEGSRRGRLSGTSSGTVDGAAAAQPSALASPAPAAAAAAAAAAAKLEAARHSSKPANPQQQPAAMEQSTQSPYPPAMRWHPTMGPLPAEHATPAWARRGARQSHESMGHKAPSPAEAAAMSPAQPIPAAGLRLPAGEPASPRPSEGPTPGSSHRSVSLLTFLLRGPSAASSAAASRESSVRSGVKRQPGGLTLALSRENSIRGGAAQRDRDGSVRSERERSMRDGSQRGQSMRDSSQRSNSLRSGGGRQEGSVLAQWGASAFGSVAPRPRAPEALHQPQAAQLQPPLQACAMGCGSGDWLGLPPVCEHLASAGALHSATTDPFAGVDAEMSPPAAVAAPRVEPFSQPHEVGSWAQRVTKFSCNPEDKAAVEGAKKHAGGPDPLLLTAALQVLATAPSASPSPGSGSASGPGSGPGCDVLVGDSDLAVTESTELPSIAQLGLKGGSPAAAAAAPDPVALSASAAPALSSSWGTAQGAAALPPVAQLGGSAPTRGLSLTTSGHSSGSPHQRRAGSQPLASDVTAATQEWNRNFQKRWRAVKKRAYLQALGLRALWRVNSVSDRHEPLELLTNDLPQCDNGMRRAWSVSRLAAQREEAHRSGLSGPQAALRRPSSATLHKDPSLSTLLLGEVAEVC